MPYLAPKLSLQVFFAGALVLFLTACQQEGRESQVEMSLPAKAEFVGSENCANCHQQPYQEWQKSHHFQAMREASEDSVLANFADQKITAHQLSYQFYTQQAENITSYWVAITENNGEITRHEISYTFGYHPLQQYLVEFDNGHIQALNMAWDARPMQEGGQRWFHLRPGEDMSKENIFHWERHYQNWNSRCADCHSTGLEKNYNIADHTYDTQWAEINIACEACHGAGSEHVRLVKEDSYQIDNTGFVTPKQTSLDWHFRDNANIASSSPNDQTQSNEIDMCGACHSFRSTLAQHDSAQSYNDLQRLEIMDDNTYFADGQIKQETFVLGSFLQSKMHDSGVTCSNCHNPHSGAVLIEGNGLCLQCHSPTAYETVDHHQHVLASTGAQCVNCHMPDRIYMQVDARRDHRFVVPNAEVTSVLGSPNPCLACHQDKDENWLHENIKPSLSTHQWALTRHAYQNGEDVLADIQDYLKTDNKPVMRSAALLATLADTPTQASFDIAKLQLSNSEPLIRRAALASMANMPVTVLLPMALKSMEDPVRSVRFEALTLLLQNYQQLSDQHKKQIAGVLDEYRESLDINVDSPEGQLAIANFAITQLDFESVEQAYQRAIAIEPNHLPALINFADFYRATNRDDLGRDLLEQAIKIEANSSSANFAYAMLLIRQQQKDIAIPHLKISTEQADSSAYYHYVYSVGLNDIGQVEQARSVVEQALLRWPSDAGLQRLSGQLSR